MAAPWAPATSPSHPVASSHLSLAGLPPTTPSATRSLLCLNSSHSATKALRCKAAPLCTGFPFHSPPQAFALPGPCQDHPKPFPPLDPSCSSGLNSDKLSSPRIKSPSPSPVYSLQRLLRFNSFHYLSACLLLSLPLECWLQERENLPSFICCRFPST